MFINKVKFTLPTELFKHYIIWKYSGLKIPARRLDLSKIMGPFSQTKHSNKTLQVSDTKPQLMGRNPSTTSPKSAFHSILYEICLQPIIIQHVHIMKVTIRPCKAYLSGLPGTTCFRAGPTLLLGSVVKCGSIMSCSRCQVRS